MQTFMNNHTGLDKRVQHIGVLMEKYDTSVYPIYQLPTGYKFISYE